MHSFHSVVSYRSSHQSNKAKMRFLSVNLTIGLRVQRYNFFFNEKKILQHNHNAVKLKTGKHTSIRGYRFCWVGDALPQNPYLLQVFKKSVREQHGCGHQKEDRQAVFFLYLELDTALLSTVKHGRLWIWREVGGKHISNCSTVAVQRTGGRASSSMQGETSFTALYNLTKDLVYCGCGIQRPLTLLLLQCYSATVSFQDYTTSILSSISIYLYIDIQIQNYFQGLVTTIF